MTLSSEYKLPFWGSYGVQIDPFAQLNAEREDRLRDYFISPPYFQSVVGDPRNPAPAVVFAPRGSGKTAQRRMVEFNLPDEVLVIPYATFPNPIIGSRPNTLNYHLHNVIRQCLLALAAHALERKLSRPNAHDIAILRQLAFTYLRGIDAIQLQNYFRSNRTLGEKTKQGFRGWTENVGTLGGYVVAAITGGVNPGMLKLPEPTVQESERQPIPLVDFQTLGDVIVSMSIPSVYILVDSIDELDETQSDRDAAYRFVAPLLENLSVIESKPFAFKFFLTSDLEQY